MSLNGFINNLSGVENNVENNTKGDSNSEIGKRRSLGKLDIMDEFLNAQVVNKYQQPWRNLTQFLKKDRMTNFFNINPDRFNKETQVKILRLITNNKFDNKNVAYDPQIGEITEVFYKE